jgi:hypothetical protein
LTKKKTEQPRYFVGDYVEPDWVRAASRWGFILAVNRLIPKCFKMLRNDVYPVFASIPSPNSASDQKELESVLSRWRFGLSRAAITSSV